MPRTMTLWKSAVGKKAVMAVSGILLFGFILLHMLGNLKVYLGAQTYNHYAHWLRQVGEPLLPATVALWIARIVLLVAVVLHIWSATSLTLNNWRARPIAYGTKEYAQADYAARTMRWGGVIIFLFVLYHLCQFTWGFHWALPNFKEGDVYHNFVAGFSVWWVSLIYIVANIALGFHLYHGLWSMFQSLGWNHPRYNLLRRRFAQVFALVIAIGNISFPLAVLTGIVK